MERFATNRVPGNNPPVSSYEALAKRKMLFGQWDCIGGLFFTAEPTLATGGNQCSILPVQYAALIIHLWVNSNVHDVP